MSQTISVSAGQYAYLDISYPPVQNGIILYNSDQGLLVTDPVSGHQLERVGIGPTTIAYDPVTGSAMAAGPSTGGTPVTNPLGVSNGPLLVPPSGAAGSVPGGNGAGTSVVPAGGGTVVTTSTTTDATTGLPTFNLSFTNPDGSINWLLVGAVVIGGFLLMKGVAK